MNDPSNICLSCGLCCDGTLIGFVQLSSEEVPALSDLMEIEDVNGKGFFLQPCSKYCDGCTIYAQRPKNCDKFNCGLLKSVDRKELAFNVALETIEEVKQKKLSIEIKIAALKIELQSKSFYFKIVELKKLLQKATLDLSETPNHLELSEDIKKLDCILMDKFKVSLD